MLSTRFSRAELTLPRKSTWARPAIVPSCRVGIRRGADAGQVIAKTAVATARIGKGRGDRVIMTAITPMARTATPVKNTNPACPRGTAKTTAITPAAATGAGPAH